MFCIGIKGIIVSYSMSVVIIKIEILYEKKIKVFVWMNKLNFDLW